MPCELQPLYAITPVLLSQVEQVAALRERILAAAVQVPWIPALQKDSKFAKAMPPPPDEITGDEISIKKVETQNIEAGTVEDGDEMEVHIRSKQATT